MMLLKTARKMNYYGIPSNKIFRRSSFGICKRVFRLTLSRVTNMFGFGCRGGDGNRMGDWVWGVAGWTFQIAPGSGEKRFLNRESQ